MANNNQDPKKGILISINTSKNLTFYAYSKYIKFIKFNFKLFDLEKICLIFENGDYIPQSQVILIKNQIVRFSILENPIVELQALVFEKNEF